MAGDIEDVQWTDGDTVRRGRIIGEEQPGYYLIEQTDGPRRVLPAGRLTWLTVDMSSRELDDRA